MGKRKHDETEEERKIRKAEKKAKKAAKAAAAEGSDVKESTKKTTNGTSASTAGELSQEEVDAYYKKHTIEVTTPDESPLPPIVRFDQLQVHASIKSELSGFKEPSPIQAASWPHLLAGKDVVGIAETGSGKTFAFGVPAMQYLLDLEKRTGIHVLVVAPTRELAIQTSDNLNLLGKESKIRSVCIYGGVSKDTQRTALKKANIVVGTPGRINDMLDDGTLDFSHVAYLVLDEADRMLDKGFEEDIKKIIGACPDPEKGGNRQTLMFSATWPEIVRKLAGTFMRNPVKVTIGSLELSANVRVTQKVEVLAEQRDKEYRLQQLIKQYQSGKNKSDRILIFALYKKEAARVEQTLKYKGHNVAAIHGDMSQVQREQALAQFKSGACPLLVATDVAARGLDIPNVTLVINLTFPLTIEDYVHRIGRTGRGGLTGVAITLFTKEDKAHSGTLINVLKQAKQEVPEELMKFGTTTKPKLDVYGRRIEADAEPMKKATKIVFD
ncbi:P-loop containing nucleoside triphosphate hydrolase protein [Protomyces lactucae-debilis]|uniref:RNA helicase n=1 Tax=Protomyces lactucae-debilis TaxID=2754530 RepID=A0A1Y2FLZ1_PROLT|nr:P-loop containing nucleoside triphosphate hydrolase protein [Protomyces lactucae-debilis]ORY84236.1 P-loop containing nucleoside triphosphate hydrolase protein [Protomyces lactucae-debilis]